MRLGVDVGGSKIEIVALARDGTQLLRRRVPTPRHDYPGTLAAISKLVQQTEAELGCSGTLGVGIPGAESALTGRIKNANSTWLIGQAMRSDLGTLLKREVRLANDANCFAISEATDGAASGMGVVFGVILGTGVGAGIVVHGRALAGINGIAGEWGHNRMPGDEAHLPPCYCGRTGCVETFLSGPALSSDHARHTGADLETVQIAELAAAGDPSCLASLRRYEVRLACALAVVINILDPDAIVLGGGVSKLGCLYENVPKLWAAQVFSDSVATRLLRSRHGDASGVRGAAWLWP